MSVAALPVAVREIVAQQTTASKTLRHHKLEMSSHSHNVSFFLSECLLATFFQVARNLFEAVPRCQARNSLESEEVITVGLLSLQ